MHLRERTNADHDSESLFHYPWPVASLKCVIVLMGVHHGNPLSPAYQGQEKSKLLIGAFSVNLTDFVNLTSYFVNMIFHCDIKFPGSESNLTSNQGWRAVPLFEDTFSSVEIPQNP
jgi:hypothetical protein